MKELELYQPVKIWLNGYLKRNLKPQSIIKTYIGANEFISKILIRKGFSNKIKYSYLFNIKVDVFSVVLQNDKAGLVLVECKTTKLTLQHLSQLMGYSRIIQPVGAVLLSPKGRTTGLNAFLSGSREYNLLSYGNNRKITIAKWNREKNEVDIINCLPKGSLSPSKILVW